MTSPNPFEPVEGQWLLENYIPSPTWVVEGYIPCGLTIFAAAPKSGKTWNMMALAVAVCAGTDFMGYRTVKGEVIYLALEDTKKRFQARLQALTDEVEGLYVLNAIPRIGDGFEEELESLLDRYPKTTLVIVDTLQKVRSQFANKGVYAADYDDAGAIKAIADTHGIAIVAVHHTRKYDAGDPFARVSGSNGLTGAADGTIVITPSKSSHDRFTFDVTGRDVERTKITAVFSGGSWSVVERLDSREIAECAVPNEAKAAADYLLSLGTESWGGSASDLMEAAGIEAVRPNVFSKKLNESRSYLAERGIVYELVRTNSKRMLEVRIRAGRDDSDDGDANAGI